MKNILLLAIIILLCNGRLLAAASVVPVEFLPLPQRQVTLAAPLAKLLPHPVRQDEPVQKKLEGFALASALLSGAIGGFLLLVAAGGGMVWLVACLLALPAGLSMFFGGISLGKISKQKEKWKGKSLAVLGILLAAIPLAILSSLILFTF